MTTEGYAGSLRAHYPELFDSSEPPLLQDEDVDTVASVYQALSKPNRLKGETDEAKIEVPIAPKGVVRAMLWSSDADAMDTLVVPRHFGGGISTDATEFAHTLRTLVPDAHVLILPNNTVSRQAKADQSKVDGQNNLGLSEDELEEIGNGSVVPFARRLSSILHDQKLDTTTLHFVGASQGALASQALATYTRDSGQLLVGSLTLVDPPTVLDSERAGRNALKLKESMPHYEESLRIGGMGHVLTPDDELLFRKGAKARPTQEYVREATKFNDFMVAQAQRLVPNLPGVTARGLHSTISTSKQYESSPDRPFIEFRGEHADHSIAMLPILVAALARRSIHLALRNDTNPQA